MAEDKKQPEKVEKTLSISYSIKPMSLRYRIIQIIAIFAVSLILVVVIFYATTNVFKIFPDYIRVSTINDLLKDMIDTDGILLGFIGIIFAQLLSSNLDQQNTLYQSILDKKDETGDKKKSLEYLDFRRNGLALVAATTFLFLLLSIFASMSNIAAISTISLSDTYGKSVMFVPLLFVIIAVVLLMVAFIDLPVRPPFEKIRTNSAN